MEKFFSVFGKLVLILLVLGGAAGAAFYFGRQSAPPAQPASTEAPAQTATPAMTGEEAVPSTNTDLGTTVTAGLGASYGLSYDQYTVSLPAGWTYTHDQDTSVPMDTLTVTRGAYMIKIFQAATGGALCLYPGDPDFEGPSSRYDTYTAITTADGTQVRRSGTTAAAGTTRGFTICQRSTDGSWGQPTHYGHMQLTTPLAPDAPILTQMDGIIASLKEV
jgi:hypothetical protein